MPLYEFAIAVGDESGSKRKKEGDVVAIAAHPHNWGLKEIDSLLIILVEHDETLGDLQELYLTPLYEGELTQADIVAMIQARAGTPLADEPLPEMISKRKYSMPLADIKAEMIELDLDKVRDKNIIYQPCKSKNQLVSKLPISKSDVDTGNPEDDEVKLKVKPRVK